jgi:hypothetical protein
VLLLNVAMDTLLSIAYPIVTPFLTNYEAPHSCDAFVAFNNATMDKRVLMGRSFMFSGDIFHEVALLVDCVPNKGNRFVSVTAPGFVGVSAAMNVKGIGIGMDMVPSTDSNYGELGMGTLLLARNTIQYANELSEAVKIILDAKKGVSWLYVLGDGKGAEIGGAVVEVSNDYQAVRYHDSTDGVNQIEYKSDLITLSNHYITPLMVSSAGGKAIEDSVWRYETITNLLLGSYGSLDIAKGKEIIDYLHPPFYGYYGTDPDAPVGASRTLFDLTNLELWSLFGHYSDQWANFKF